MVVPAPTPVPSQVRRDAASAAAPGSAAARAAPQSQRLRHEPVAASRPRSASAPSRAVQRRPVAAGTREEQLARALNAFMTSSPDIQAAALVSASTASPWPRRFPRACRRTASARCRPRSSVSASARRPSSGAGTLSQVFIEGDDGYVLLIAAGRPRGADRARRQRRQARTRALRHAVPPPMRIGEILG